MEVAKQSRSKTSILTKLADDVNCLSLDGSATTNFQECIQNILTVNFEQLNKEDEVCRDAKFDVSIKSLMRFSKRVINCIGTTSKVSGQRMLGTVCNVATTVITYFFAEQDVSAFLMTRFGTIMNEELRSKCLASCIKIKHCISYMQGLPNPNRLGPDDKKMHLLLMATDVPVQTGLDELLYLGEKIRKLVKSAIHDKNNFEDLMRNVELYCCLATFRELFLLYRFSFQSMLEVNAESVRNVIDAQQENDQSVLEFLYKPTVENVILFYEVLQGDWPLLMAFCERRGLLVEDLVVLDKGVYIIESVADKSKLYTISDSYLRSGKVIDCVFMESSRRKGRNVFSFQIESNFVGASESARHLCLTDTKEFWYVLKVRGNTSIDKECYMIWLKSDIKKCLCQERKDSRFLALPFGQQTTCLSTPKDIGSNFLWTIESL